MGISRKPNFSRIISVILHSFILFLLVFGSVASPDSPAVAANQIDIVGPPGSGEFGHTVTVLPNGNFVVCDPQYNDGSSDVGAVYLYDGASGDQISMLTGSTSGDFLCSNSVTVLANGNYVVSSPEWNNGAGAVTWGNSTTGISGVVSSANSLVGNTANDFIGGGGVTALTNGNYVVRSPQWDNGSATNAGAVTWGDGTTGITGVVNPDNSLVGSTNNDQVGMNGVTVLTNGNYVVPSPAWDGTATDTGAVTWGDGTIGVTGEINVANSLVGSTAGDHVGFVTALPSGNYVVRSPEWDNGTVENAGAVTWGDGTTGITGTVSITNSLVGSNNDDQVGFVEIKALSNGNYLVSSPHWDNEGVVFAGAGAVTWGDGMTGITGEVSSANSLVGSTSSDGVGWSITELTNGNYVVVTPYWDNGLITNAGAVTWGDGTTGVTGTISSLNSLVGSTIDDWVGIYGALPLFNGNYVVRSPWWDSPTAENVGAVTWADGMTGITGTINATNSLVGSTASDYVGQGDVRALTNGNYVVCSPTWNTGTVDVVGAVTWGDGSTGITGEVSPANSLVGKAVGDAVGDGGVTVLTNGNYVVVSPTWDNGPAWDGGAITWGDGTTGIVGEVSTHNSLVGSTPDDRIGSDGVKALDNGNYLVFCTDWDNGSAEDAGAVTWGDGTGGTTGTVSPSNSLVGSKEFDWVGEWGVSELTNGNYVVVSPYWDNGGIDDAGAVTWGDGMTGIRGEVSSANSLVGSKSDDRVGEDGVAAMPNGNYAVKSSHWDNDTIEDAGAISWGDVNLVTTGGVTYDNSVRGKAPDGGASLNFAYDEVNDQLVVGRPEDNIVTLFRPNRVPVADAGPDQSVSSGASVMLDGSTSYDPDGNIPLTYAWVQMEGTPVTLSGSATATPAFTAPAVTQTSALTFTVVVIDSLGMPSMPDEVVITVKPYTALLPMVLNGE